MNKKTWLPAVIFIALAGLAIFFISNDKQKQSMDTNKEVVDSGLVLFYGDGCPHCAIVDEFIANNKTEEKIYIEHKEVYNNKANQELLRSKAAICGLPTNSIGVPFLWDGESCFVGDVNIKGYLSLLVQAIENPESLKTEEEPMPPISYEEGEEPEIIVEAEIETKAKSPSELATEKLAEEMKNAPVEHFIPDFETIK